MPIVILPRHIDESTLRLAVTYVVVQYIVGGNTVVFVFLIDAA
jgi:hypothetical protein